MGVFGRYRGSDPQGDDGTGDLLRRVLGELEALSRRVSDRQHAADQARRATEDAVTTGFARVDSELRAVRGALDDLARLSRREPRPPREEPREEPRGEPRQEPRTERREKCPEALETETRTLLRAAGISCATVRAHRDTWAFVVEHASPDRHFRVPGSVVEEGEAVSVRVSGPSLVAALTRLRSVSRTDDDPGTRAIAGHLHERLTQTVRDVVEHPHRGDGAPPVTIVIDDRVSGPPYGETAATTSRTPAATTSEPTGTTSARPTGTVADRPDSPPDTCPGPGGPDDDDPPPGRS
ncbi:hypothetical protein GCM10018785_16770 [Streptomyces longispororuber]|uniref:Uncharacterized protein n=1 Tax=Streptomyces longispororuber TaxID=68230 RepID=A0A918ZF16_9ACTN|nr:hypothetical protein [Streptomyces longispororuber]GHE47795.1 hypothetical protein GCM10018785_16770 [Streptomyces longispororuber]